MHGHIVYIIIAGSHQYNWLAGRIIDWLSEVFAKALFVSFPRL